MATKKAAATKAPEKTTEAPQSDRSDEEKAANAARSKAEAAKFKAEARKFAAEAEKAEHDATQSALATKKAIEDDDIRRAGNSFYHLYMFNGEVSGASVKAAIDKLSVWSRTDPGCDIEIIFNSGGGAVTEGFVLFDYIRTLSNNGHHITTGTLGMAASMAGILLQSGDTRYSGNEAWLMIHRAAFGAAGQTFDIEDRVKWVKRIEARIIAIFANRSGGKLTSTKIKRNWDRQDWWISSDEALEMGLVDEIRGRPSE